MTVRKDRAGGRRGSEAGAPPTGGRRGSAAGPAPSSGGRGRSAGPAPASGGRGRQASGEARSSGGRGRHLEKPTRNAPPDAKKPTKPAKYSPGPWDAGAKRGARAKTIRNDTARQDTPRRGELRGQPKPPARLHTDKAGEPRRHQPRSDTESLVYGMRSVASLLAADSTRIARLFIEESRLKQADVRQLMEDAQSAGLHVQRVSGEELANLSHGAVHQGVLAEVAPFEFSTVEELLKAKGEPLLLVLDEVTDPQNLGAAARAAWALGATGLILPKDRTAHVTAAAEKVASGALAHLAVAEVVNLARTLEDLKKRGVWIIGLDVDGDRPLHRQDLTLPCAIVVGSEHTGMRQLTRKMCDAVVHIPMAHHEAALNAADAAAVALYEASRQRLLGGAQAAGDDDEDGGEEE